MHRRTPCLLGLFSVVLLLAHQLSPAHLPTRQAAWYTKREPTFVDALAAVRRHLWTEMNAPTLIRPSALANPPTPLMTILIEAATYVA